MYIIKRTKDIVEYRYDFSTSCGWTKDRTKLAKTYNLMRAEAIRKTLQIEWTSWILEIENALELIKKEN